MTAVPSSRAFLSTVPAGRGERRLALVVVLVSALAFAIAAPHARTPLPVIPAFIPSYESALAISELVIAAMLFGQVLRLRTPGLLALASGYLFNALMIVPHALTFPGAFAPAGLLGAGPQTTAWLYIFWHGGFPLFVMAYALLGNGKAPRLGTAPGKVAGAAVGGVVALALAFTLLATRGEPLLPPVMAGGDYAMVVSKGVTPTVWLLSLAALAVLCRRRPLTVLDLWLAVTLTAWLFDIALSGIIGSSRYDLGWYAGRSYGLLAANFVLVVLLIDMNRLYRQLAESLETAEAGNAALLESREELGRVQRFEALGHLTGGVAHDFNNLLTVITGNLDLILQGPGNAQRVARLAGMAMRAAQRGEQLTRQLLTFARRQVSRPETVNLNRLVTDCLGILHQAAGSGVEIELQLSPVLDPVHIDPSQLESALLNLVLNARDAMASQGRIAIETRNLVLAPDADRGPADLPTGDYVQLSVRDTGAGMAPEVLARAFEPFFTTKDVGKGSGLGLSQVYGFARSAGGQAVLASQPGAGTTVQLYLPRSRQRAAPAAPRHAEIGPLRRAANGETILVVEDDPEVLSIAVEGLADLGYAVVTAANAAQALDILRSGQPIDLMFSDVIMPGGMNGAQLAVEARRLRPDLKVLLTSGYTAMALATEHGLPEDLEIINKPYRREDLATKLKLVIGGG